MGGGHVGNLISWKHLSYVTSHSLGCWSLTWSYSSFSHLKHPLALPPFFHSELHMSPFLEISSYFPSPNPSVIEDLSPCLCASIGLFDPCILGPLQPFRGRTESNREELCLKGLMSSGECCATIAMGPI